MVKKRWKKTLSLILSAAMIWGMSGMPAFAEEPAAPASVPVVESEVPPVTDPQTNPTEPTTPSEPDPQPETKTCTCTVPCIEGGVNAECPVCSADWSACASKDEETQPEEKVCTCDPQVSGEEGHTNPECPFYKGTQPEEKVCTCDPQVSGEEGHTNPECPFYKGTQPEEKVCTCDPQVEGEEGHTNPECPFYKKDEVPTENEETKDLIEKLPSLEEYHQWKPTLELSPEDEGYQAAYDAAVAAHRKEVEEQVKAARAAYDLMPEEQKAAFDPALTAKLTTWETKLSQPVTDMESRLSGLPSVEEFQNWKPTLTIPEADPGYQAAYDAAVAAHRKEVEEQVKAVREAYDALGEAERAVLDPALVAKFDALMALLTQAVPLTTGPNIYVSSTKIGGIEDGTQEHPFTSLKKAVDAANGSTEKNITIHVLSDLTSTACARIVDKNITITSDGGPYTITRGDSFETTSDNSRSWYNPAMIEVTTPGEKGASLTLTNIILDDGGKHEGAVFAQATGTNDTQYVQDGIVAAYGTSSAKADIILGDGAVLKDFGGMSAVRVTGGASLTMNSGSQILDDTVIDRIKGDTGSNGPAGAVWVQGTNATMNAGASIRDVVGRAFYVDGGSATISGTISGIKVDKDMWQGTAGIAIHARGDCDVTLSNGGKITAIEKANVENDTAVATYGSDFTMDPGSEIFGLKNVMAIYADDMGNDYLHNMLINGTIRDCSTTDSLARSWYGLITIGPNGLITGNKATGAGGVMYTNNGSKYIIEGKLIGNTGRTVFYLANQSGGRVTAEMRGDNAEISGGSTAVRVNNGSLFTMNGGTIKENTTGVQVSGKANFKGVEFIMNGGTIEDNRSGISYTVEGQSKVQLNGGTIQNNGTNYQVFATGGSAQDAYENIYIHKGVLVGNPTIYTSFGTITLDEGYSNIWLGKAITETKNKLDEKVREKNSNYNFVGSTALWLKPSQDTFHFTMPRPYSVKDGQSLYWGLIPLKADGTPEADAKATVEKITNTENLSIELKGLKPDKPYAVGLFTKNAVNIVPANMIIYMGGTDGADGTIDNENGHIQGSKTLPEPGFRVGLPKELEKVNVTDLKLQYEENGNIFTWKFEKYGQGEHNVYRISPDGDTTKRAVRMKFTKKDGTIITEDKFDAGKNLNQTLDMEIYGEGIKAGDVSIVYNGKNYEIDTSSAEITVLGTTAKEQYGILGENASAGKPGLTAPDGTTFTVNNSAVQVNNTGGVALLFDGIIEDTSSETNRTQLLQKRANKEINEEVPAGMTRHYDLKYLDLVDRNNGNTWVKASQDVTVSWPYPAGTDKNTEFTLLHFKGLHRDMTSGEVEGEIANCTVDNVPIVQTDTHITFTIGKGGFSPFALVWDSATPTPGPGPDPEPEKPDRPTGGGSSTYDPQAKDPDRVQVSLEARKLLDGKTPGKQEFTFTLTDEKGKVVRTAENKGGKIVFDPLALLPGTYRYTMEEVNGSGGSAFGYDDTVYEAEVFVYTSGGKYTAMVSYYEDGKELDKLPTFRNTTAPAAPGTDKENPITGGGPAFPAALTAALSLGAIALLWRKRS